MDKISVVVLNEGHSNPIAATMFLATLTQQGHKFKTGQDLLDRYSHCMNREWKTIESVIKLPHGTINRFAPVTLAIVGASRRFLAQIRTHHIGIEWVSASLQYSDYSDDAQFVVPYELMEHDKRMAKTHYLGQCALSMSMYRQLVGSGCDNDTAGYVAPQGLRNVLIATATRDTWMNIISVRSCLRNTNETAFVTNLIWKALYEQTTDGELLYGNAGPTCKDGKCLEGFMTCGTPVKAKTPDDVLKEYWPLIDTSKSVLKYQEVCKCGGFHWEYADNKEGK